MRSPTVQTAEIIALYLAGLSAKEVGKEYGLCKNSVVALLRFHGVCRLSMGRDDEARIAEYYRGLGVEVKQMPGDAPFDLKMLGATFDVKTSSIQVGGFYKFSLWKKRDRLRKDNWATDYFILFLKDTREIFYMSTKEVPRYAQSLSFHPGKTKKEYHLIGHLT
jgi:hypothetical protein